MRSPSRILKTLSDRVRHGEGLEYLQYWLAEKLSNLIYPRFKFSDFGRIFLEDKEFLQWYQQQCGSRNYHTLDRKYVLHQFCKLVDKVAGDSAECGCFQGASSFFICQGLKHTHKLHHVFDSFQGLSQPESVSVDGYTWQAGDFAVPESQVKERLKQFPNVRLYKGWIPERFSEVADRQFCYVHIDVDLVEPTLKSLEFFYPRTSSGGIIICDDYGFRASPGAYKAFHDFFADKPEQIVSLPTGQGFVIRD